MKLSKTQTLDYNVKIHDKIAKRYEHIHYEIYNEIEQNRLKGDLKVAIKNINTFSNNRIAIDYGCGAGNLTRHLSDLGMEVIAADISEGFLALINSRTYKKNVRTVKLNGYDLSNIPNESVDMIATYSVLHHIPDYLSILTEFLRVLKKGGIIYIDHESSDSVWINNEDYLNFKKKALFRNKFWLRKFFVLNNYIDFFIRLFYDSKYRREGDIHVFPESHIEWDRIDNIIQSNGGEKILDKNYLLFKSDYKIEIYNRFKNDLNDMHLGVYIKA